jgi:hypothetical protein
MLLRHEITIKLDPALERKLDQVSDALLNQTEIIMAILDDLTANVTKITSEDDAIIQLLVNVKAKLDAALANPSNVDVAALQALSTTLGNESDKVAAAVVANTQAA